MPSPAGNAPRGQVNGAVDFLLRRIQRTRDFPVLSETIRTLNRLAASSEKSVEQLAAVIVRDFALSNKILKVVNSAFYSQYSGKVGTISRAIVVLGIRPVRALAASLILFDQLADMDNADRVKSLVGKSMFSALLARAAARDTGIRDAEEVFLATMFQNLGELLVAYYLPGEDQAIQEALKEPGTSPAQAQLRVLGVELGDLGGAIGSHWNFPHVITHSMQRIPPERAREPINEDERIRLLASFASAVTDRLCDEQAAEADFTALLEHFEQTVPVDESRFEILLTEARSEYRVLTQSLTSKGPASNPLRMLAGLPPDGEQRRLEENPLADVSLPASNEEQSDGRPDREAMLLEGLQEATLMLSERPDLKQVAQVVLETLYRAFDLHRSTMFLRDARRQAFVARLGFGEDIERILPVWHFPEAYSADLFHIALDRQTDVHIADIAGGGNNAHGLPEWFAVFSRGGSLLFLPLVRNGRSVGFIVAEHGKRDGMPLPPTTLRLVRALRNQLVLTLQLGTAARQ